MFTKESGLAQPHWEPLLPSWGASPGPVRCRQTQRLQPQPPVASPCSSVPWPGRSSAPTLSPNTSRGFCWKVVLPEVPCASAPHRRQTLSSSPALPIRLGVSRDHSSALALLHRGIGSSINCKASRAAREEPQKHMDPSERTGSSQVTGSAQTKSHCCLLLFQSPL